MIVRLQPNPELIHRLIEKPCCSFFGCGRQLTEREALFGDRCINHQKKYDNSIIDNLYKKLKYEKKARRNKGIHTR